MSLKAFSTTTKVPLTSGHTIPALGLGVYLTQPHIAPDAVYTALQLGYRHIDSARIYQNERDAAEGILRFLDDRPDVQRKDIFFTTKVWDSDQGYEGTRIALAESLDKLTGESDETAIAQGRTLGYFDMVLVHTARTSTHKRLETWRALQEAVSSGIVKSIGVSNFGIPHLEQLLSWEGLKVRPVVNQVELHPWRQRRELVHFLKKNEIVPEAYSPLTQGIMLGDKRLLSVAGKYGKSPAQILIKWALMSGFICIPKSIHESRMRENMSVDDFELSPEDFESLGDKDGKGFRDWDPTIYPVDR